MDRKKIEDEAESIIAAAVRNYKGSVQYQPSDGYTPEEWEEVEGRLSCYGSIVHYNDEGRTARFDVNPLGRQLIAKGGFKALEEEQQRREREVDAAEKAAEAARKSAEYAAASAQAAERTARQSRIANYLTVGAILASVIISLKGCK